MGMIYFTLEGVWRSNANIIMLLIGGICSVLIGLLNEYPQYYKLKIYQQTLIGTFIVLIVEFVSGMFFNVFETFFLNKKLANSNPGKFLPINIKSGFVLAAVLYNDAPSIPVTTSYANLLR